MEKNIILKGVRTRNLKNIDIDIPLNRITAIVGVSGAGKSSLAFHTLYAEGYIRYIESISPYIRQFLDQVEKPDSDGIDNLPPAVAFRQKRPHKNPRSIVATAADIFDYLRILYAKIADFHCPSCGKPVRKYTIDEIVGEFAARPRETLRICFAYQGDIAFLVNRGYYFQVQDGKKTGIDSVSRNKAILVLIDELENTPENRARLFEAVDSAIALSRNTIFVFQGGEELRFPFSLFCPHCRKEYESPDENLFSFNSARGACPDCNGLGDVREKAHKVGARAFPGSFTSCHPCPACKGRRFNPLALAFRIQGKSIADFLSMTIGEADAFISGLDKERCRGRISPDVFHEITAKLDFLIQNRLHYIQLDRPTFTLSRGEHQRINLAFIMGSTLSDSLLIIDQPSADLHPADYGKMAGFLRRLKENGNTVVLVEHNPHLVRGADHVIELGPGAGREGGHVVFSGSREKFFASRRTTTQQAFNRRSAPLAAERAACGFLEFRKACAHNLKGFDLRIPRQALTIIAGVSGAGKSSLLYDEMFLKHPRLPGIDEKMHIDPGLGSLRPNTNIAAFLGASLPVREFFAGLRSSRLLGYLPGHFSFHSPLGRCPECQGRGWRQIEMQFLPAVRTVCGHCHGNGFAPDVLKIAHRGRNIADVLAMSVEEFRNELGPEIPVAAGALQGLADNGMGYLRLGERLSGLSTGEMQKLKLLKHLGGESSGMLFLLDEPSFGLHPCDVVVLRELIARLLARGNTVAAVEHNLELIAGADFVVELGPEGGDGGGYLLFSSVPAAMPGSRKSPTGIYLKKYRQNT